MKKLGSASYAEREAASAELLKHGISALPAVKAAAETSDDAEIRERALALIDPLSKASESSKLLAVKTIVFDGKTVPLSAAVADFKQKTGIPLLIVPGSVNDTARPVTLPSGEYTPWDGLALLLKAAGLREDHRAELPSNGQQPQQNLNRYRRGWDDGNEQMSLYNCTNAPVLLMDGTPNILPTARSGGIRITALPPGFSSNRVVRGIGRVVFHLDAAPVPSTGWHGATGVRILHAEDEDGRPVFADLKLAYEPMNTNPYNNWNGGFGRRVFWGGNMNSDDGNGSGLSPNHNPRLVPVAIRTNDRAVKTLRQFEGVVLGDVHTPNMPVITIKSLDKAAGVSHNGPLNSNLQVQEFKKSDSGVVSLKIRHEALTQWAMQNMRGGGAWATTADNPGDVLNKIKFYAADGKELTKPTASSTNYSGDGWRQSVDVTLNFPKGVLPAKMVLTGIKVTPVEVPFKLENVSVP